MSTFPKFRTFVRAIHPPRAICSIWLVFGMKAGHDESAVAGEPYPFLMMGIYFIVFQMLYGAIYLINDLIDYQSDRKHPSKCKRMVASGAISRKAALLYAITLIAVFVGIALNLSVTFFWYGMLFLVYNFLYTVYLKTIPYVCPVAGGVTHALRYVMGYNLFGTLTTFYAPLAILALMASLWYLRRLTEFETHEETRHILRFYTRPSLLTMIGLLGLTFPLLASFAPAECQFRLVIGCGVCYLFILYGYFFSAKGHEAMQRLIFHL